MKMNTAVQNPFKCLFIVLTLIVLLFHGCQERELGPADFEGKPRSGKAPLEVEFTDKSSLDVREWDWKFPGGSPSEAEGKGPHTVKYNEQGNYDVTLEILFYAETDTVPRIAMETKVKYITVTTK